MDWLLQLDINDALLMLEKELLGDLTAMANIIKIARAQEKGEIEYELKRILAETSKAVEKIERLIDRRK